MTEDIFFNSLIQKVAESLTDKTTDFEIQEDGGCYIIEDERQELKSPLSSLEIRQLGTLFAKREGKRFSERQPILNVEYKGWRLNFNLPPLKQSPTLIIRIHNTQFRNLDNLVKQGMLSKETAELLASLVEKRKNIMISGETSSGKTTFLSALVDLIDPSQKVILIEDTQEITTTHRILGRMKTTDATTPEQAIADCLRQNPDRIIYGEVRTSAALDLLKSWNTGHMGGMGTIHSNSCLSIPERLNQLCMEKEGNSNSQMPLIDLVLDIGIQIDFINNKRKVVEIYDYHEKKYLLKIN